MIEYARTSTHLASLPTTLNLIREANHPNVRPMLDFFHTWSGLTKFEDMDMLKPGELAHVHFQDILDTPREIIDNNGRVIPGDGNAPVVKMLQKLKEKQYSGALSVELFLTRLTQGDAQAVGADVHRDGGELDVQDPRERRGEVLVNLLAFGAGNREGRFAQLVFRPLTGSQ